MCSKVLLWANYALTILGHIAVNFLIEEPCYSFPIWWIRKDFVIPSPRGVSIKKMIDFLIPLNQLDSFELMIFCIIYSNMRILLSPLIFQIVFWLILKSSLFSHVMYSRELNLAQLFHLRPTFHVLLSRVNAENILMHYSTAVLFSPKYYNNQAIVFWNQN